MKLAEYQAKVAALVEDDEGKKLVAHTVDGLKIVIRLGEFQQLLLAREYEVELPVTVGAA
jgi:hypothetical protein